MKNSYYQPQRSNGPDWFDIFMIISVMLFLFALKSNGQTHCEKEKIFIGGFTIEATKKFPTVITPYLGISGIYGKGKIYDNFSAIIGARFDKVEPEDKSKSEAMSITPTGSILYRMRFRGTVSKLIHAFGVSTSLNQVRFTQYDWRIYGAPTVYSFATFGGMVGWNNQTGISVGFTVLGFF